MLKVVFNDEALFVVDKPPDLVVTVANTYQEQKTLEEILRSRYQIKIERSGIVHRLDKDTSGLLVIAKTRPSLAHLQAQFKERKVKKEYLALVHGLVKERGTINTFIARNPRNREKFTVIFSSGGEREAVTEYEPIKKFKVQNSKFKDWFPDFNNIQLRKLEKQLYGEFTLLKCKPLTGRTHQIRVHLKYLGHPVVGDDKYGGRKVVRLDHRWCGRQFLHASKLEFTHPTTGQNLSFESDLPEDLQQVLEKLEQLK